MTAAPSNPFDLAAHLIDSHYQDAVFVDAMDADQLRADHTAAHTTGLPDHEHTEDA